jgi:hypothetical protein
LKQLVETLRPPKETKAEVTSTDDAEDLPKEEEEIEDPDYAGVEETPSQVSSIQKSREANRNDIPALEPQVRFRNKIVTAYRSAEGTQMFHFLIIRLNIK